MRKSLHRGLVAAMVAVALVGCSDDGESSDTAAPTTTAAPIPVGQAPLLVDQIRPAMAALEAQLGGPQQYFEVNATPTLVNLFVATEDGTQAVAYIYAVGELQDPAAPQTASGPTFAASEVAFDETKVIAQVVAQLPSSSLRVFSVLGVEGGGVSYAVTTQSAQGGQLEVPVSADGSILGATGS